MTTTALTTEMQTTMLEAGWTPAEVAQMYLCECGCEPALYQPSRHPVMVCGDCWTRECWM